MKSLFAVAAVVAALALAAPAGAMPIIDPPESPHSVQVPATPVPDSSGGSPLLVVLIVGGAAFLTGAAFVRLVRVPRRQTA